MKLTQRLTHAFIEIEVDVVKETIYNDHKQEIQDTIDNLTDVLDDLYSMLNKEVFINVLNK